MTKILLPAEEKGESRLCRFNYGLTATRSSI